MRSPQWERRLADYLDGLVSVPFDPVSHNCAVFALGVVEAVTEQTADEVLAVVGVKMPQSEIDVGRILVECSGVTGIASRLLGDIRQDIGFARRGDIVLFDGIDGDTLGVVEVAGAICLTPSGLRRFPMSEAKGYWSLG